jgi:HK97 family phage portal protein
VNILGFSITRKSAPAGTAPNPIPQTGRPSSIFGLVVREPFTGAWQLNQEVNPQTVLSYSAVFACVALIAQDIGKLGLRLVEQDDDGIWTETTAAAFSPVLRKPNRYQTRIKFIEQWLLSKLMWGNAYILKQRDASGIVRGLYVLNPTRVYVLIAPDGSVYYELLRDNLASLTEWPASEGGIVAPASEIIHDPMICLYHPLIGVTPIYACGLAATQGLAIQNNSAAFFTNKSSPGGILTAPGAISDETAARLKTTWETNFGGQNYGRVALVGDGLTYEPMAVNANDAQMIEQLKWSAETVCSCFHVPAFMVGIGAPPTYTNIEALNQQYYSQCLQSLIENLELSLDEGLGLVDVPNHTYGTEFDLDDLLRMDTTTKTAAAKDGVSAGCLSPNEARKRYFDLGPVEGGDTPYLQQQEFSLAALAKRDAADPFVTPAPAPTPPPTDPAADTPPDDQVKDIGTVAAAELGTRLRAA